MCLPVRRIASRAPVLFPKKCHANCTIHAAGCNQGSLERVLRSHYMMMGRGPVKKAPNISRAKSRPPEPGLM